ncbi:hypothetical protein [Tabrizicola sp. TH137]|uniref:hypothetical protein n=1 Tax=Tabrizicola sp. TH137 TaxID=2067452 RepID=UPI001C1FB725|nr:hypothetical protein [Tabrizicola sp. TH137]
MHPIALADELAEIRAEIARLKAREMQVRDLILASPPGGQAGRWHKAEVTEHRVRMFDASLLPPAIRENPAFWRERVQTTVRTVPVQTRTPRPGWPIRRAVQAGEAGQSMH